MSPPDPNLFHFDGKETKPIDQVDPNGYYKKKAQYHVQYKQNQTEAVDFIKKHGYRFRFEGNLRCLGKLIYMCGPGLVEASPGPYTLRLPSQGNPYPFSL